MRHILLAALTFAACASKDPPLPPPDAATCPAACMAAGGVCASGICVYPPIDSGMVDVGGGMDVQQVDAVDVFIATDPAPIVDQGIDAGAPDVPGDQGAPDSGTTDAPVDRPDVRIACSSAGGPDLACLTNNDCSVCIPGALGEPWCCSGGYCRSSSTTCP